MHARTRSTEVFRTRDRPVAQTYSRYRTTLTTDRQTCPPPPSGGIRTRNPSKRAAADPRLRPRGHWDRPKVFTVTYKYYFKPFVTLFVLQGRAMAQTVCRLRSNTETVSLLPPPKSTSVFPCQVSDNVPTPVHRNLILIKRQAGAIWERPNKATLFRITGDIEQKGNFTLLSSSRALTLQKGRLPKISSYVTGGAEVLLHSFLTRH